MSLNFKRRNKDSEDFLQGNMNLDTGATRARAEREGLPEAAQVVAELRAHRECNKGP